MLYLGIDHVVMGAEKSYLGMKCNIARASIVSGSDMLRINQLKSVGG